MNRVFIHAYCQYPHSGARANYIENLAKAIMKAGYEVVLATDLNPEYDFSLVVKKNQPVTIVPVMPDIDPKIWKTQRSSGFWAERLEVMQKYEIGQGDVVLLFGIESEYFVHKLLEFGKHRGFKIICGVLELFGAEDYKTREKYEKAEYLKGEIYSQADAVLSISEYIDKYYIEKGTRVYRLPPMIDSDEHDIEGKSTDKYRFIIPSYKDSLKSMLMAFVGLEDEELSRIELHLCGIKEEQLKELVPLPVMTRLHKFAVIHNWMRYEELIALYQKMNFLVITRNVCRRTLANFPSKVPETMALGVIPIVSDVGDYTKYYLRDGYDSIFIHGDSSAETMRAIRKALSMDRKEYMDFSAHAEKTSREHFDYRVWIPKIKEMIEER